MEAYMRVIKRHKRCPHCDGLHTRKHGFRYRKKRNSNERFISVLRWYCYTCKRSFSDIKSIHKFQYAISAARHYFVGRASYRNTAKILHIDRMTAYTHIQAVCQRTKFPWELSQELTPTWSGYLLLDSDEVIVHNQHQYLLTAVDSATRDIPSALLMQHQGLSAWEQLLDTLTAIHYPFKAIISDGFSSIISAVKNKHPHIPHQLCVKHFYDETYRFFRYRPFHMHLDSKLTNLFMDLLRPVLFAHSFAHHQGELNHLLNHPKLAHLSFKEPIQRLRCYLPYLTRYLFDRNIPRTTNIIENVFSQLDLKLNPIIKFGSHESAWNTIKSVIAWYRFKKFSNCRKRYQYHNGKAPLELAGVTLKNTPWIYQSIRQF
jgi:transposase-like protein